MRKIKDQNESQQTESMTMNVDELARVLNINITAAYNLCRRPGFPAIRVSERRIVVPREALHKWLLENANA